MNVVNLARRPFENLRPVRRLSVLMWTVGGLLMFANLWLYWGHLTGFSATRGQLADVRTLIDEEADKLDQVEADVAALALDSQNQTVSDLNQLIEKRVFPWSLLFDRLEGILPHESRLLGVRPEGQEIKITRREQGTRSANTRQRGRRAPRARAPEPTGIVDVGLNGIARTDEALLTLIDALWSDPTFDNPSLKGERRNQTNEIDFSLNVEFLTEEAASLADAGESAGSVESAVASVDVEDARATTFTEEGGPIVAPPPVSPSPAAAALSRAASRGDVQADGATASRTPADDREAPPRAVSRSGRPSTRSAPSARPRTSSGRSTTDTSRAGRSATAPVPQTPQVPGVVVLPGARSVPQAAPVPNPTSPTAPNAPAPTRPAQTRPTNERPSPTSPQPPTADSDTPAPPSQNASSGASLGGGAP